MMIRDNGDGDEQWELRAVCFSDVCAEIVCAMRSVCFSVMSTTECVANVGFVLLSSSFFGALN